METTPVFVVGGVVRDQLLGRQSTQNDLDVAIEHSALQIGRRVADRLGWAYYPLDTMRDVARLIFTAATPPLVCDISAMRGGTIDSDLRARDFTVNAMAVEWRGRTAVRLVDPMGGRADLEQRILRRVSATSLADDPVRVLRALRFAVQLDFTIEEQTLLQVMRMGDTVKLASAERVRDELWKIMLTTTPAYAIDLLQRHGILHPVLPEIADLMDVAQSAPHVLDVYRHTLLTVSYAQNFRAWLSDAAVPDDRPATRMWQKALEPFRFHLRHHFMQTLAGERMHLDWLVWYALWHDAGKPATRAAEEIPGGGLRYRFLRHEEIGADLMTARLDALRFGRHESALADTVVRAHMRPHHLHATFKDAPISRRALYRFFRDTGGHQWELVPGVDVVLLALADYQAIYDAPMPDDWEGYLRHAVELLDYAFSTQGLEQARHPLIDGHTVMRAFNLEPGRQIGSLLDRLLEAQVAGEIATRMKPWHWPPPGSGTKETDAAWMQGSARTWPRWTQTTAAMCRLHFRALKTNAWPPVRQV